MHFNTESLISRLRPMVLEILSSSSASSLTLEAKVERLREALMEESPEIIRKVQINVDNEVRIIFLIRSHFESSKFDLHAKNLFLKLKNITKKETNSQGEENLEKLKIVEETSQKKTSNSDVTERKKLRARLSFSNLDSWNSHLEITSTPRSLVEEAAMRERKNFQKIRPHVSIENLIQGKTSVSTSSMTDIQKIRRVVFSPFNYPSLPLKELGRIVPEDGKLSVELLTEK